MTSPRTSRSPRAFVAAVASLLLTGALSVAAYEVGRARPAHARRGPEIMPLEEVTPGMKGHAVTVFSGTSTDRFEIEVVDVVPDFVPGQSVILFRALDPRLQHSGVVGGMSGSPIYIDGKMIGALAYGWSFNKDPLGGITPIEYMLEVGEMPFRPDVMPLASGRDARHGGRADAMLGLDTSPLPTRRRPGTQDVAGATPLALPMTLGGFGPRTANFLSEELGLTPVMGGSGGGKAARGDQKKQFAPGDSVSVVLIGGDNAVAPNGTVTWVGGKKDSQVLAFGHPLFGSGPSNFPIADARVHTIVNSVQRSVKLSSPRHIQGTLIQDRQPAISARTDLTAPTIPVTTTIRAPDETFTPRTYNNLLAVDPSITGTFLASVLMSGLEEAAGDEVELTAKLHHEITLETSKGVRTVALDEEIGFPAGIVPAPIYRAGAVQLVSNALQNRFERGRVIEIRQEATVEYGVPVRRVAEVRLATADLRPGDLAALDVRLVHDRQPDQWRRVEVRIPDDVAGQKVLLRVAGSLSATPPQPLVKDADALLDAIVAAYPPRSLVVSVFSADEGLATERGRIDDLPGSILETLDPVSSTSRALRTKRASHRVVQTPASLMYGTQSLTIEVGPPRIEE